MAQQYSTKVYNNGKVITGILCLTLPIVSSGNAVDIHDVSTDGLLPSSGE
jgi:hypothetical protein